MKKGHQSANPQQEAFKIKTKLNKTELLIGRLETRVKGLQKSASTNTSQASSLVRKHKGSVC